MNREELAELAHVCGLTDRDLGDFMTDYGYSEESITKFAAAIRAATKEEDAKIADNVEMRYSKAGEAIRASK